MKKVIVNENCIGCGACTGISDVFHFNDEGFATADENRNIVDKMDEETKENVTDALECCPVNAIEMIEVEENKIIEMNKKDEQELEKDAA